MEKKLNITQCPTCGSKKIIAVKKDWLGDFKGKKYKVELLEYYECPECQEKIYDKEAMQKIQEKSPAFKKHYMNAAA